MIKVILIVILSILILTALINILLTWYKRKKIEKSEKIKWVIVLEMITYFDDECRMCRLLESSEDGSQIKVQVPKYNEVRIAKLVGANYYFEDQYELALKHRDSVRLEKLKKLKYNLN